MIDMYHNTKNFLLRWVRIAFYQTGLKPCDPADLCLLNSQNYKCEPPTPEKGDRALNKGAEEAKKKKKKIENISWLIISIITYVGSKTTSSSFLQQIKEMYLIYKMETYVKKVSRKCLNYGKTICLEIFFYFKDTKCYL
jgi:hypothetical protein